MKRTFRKLRADTVNTDVMSVGAELDKILGKSGVDAQNFWKNAVSVVLMKMESGSAVPKDLMNSSLWKNMPEDARAGLQNIAVTAELKQDFKRKLDTVKKQGLDALIANYDRLNAGALEIADRVPTAVTDLDKAIADKAGASLENTMKQNGTDAARAAKEKILASLGNNEAAKNAVETKFKAVEQNYLKEKALNALKKMKTAGDFAQTYAETMNRNDLDSDTKTKIKAMVSQAKLFTAEI